MERGKHPGVDAEMDNLENLRDKKRSQTLGWSIGCGLISLAAGLVGLNSAIEYGWLSGSIDAWHEANKVIDGLIDDLKDK